jgi:hypothetical protein
MKVGDLVTRKLEACELLGPGSALAQEALDLIGFGIILSKQPGGSNPVHPCITVLYPKVGKTYDIAESLVEVISESR